MKSKLPTIEIVPKQSAKSGKISTGANTQVLLNGKPLNGCRRIRVDIEAASVAHVRLDMYARVKGKVTAALKPGKIRLTNFHTADGYLGVYTISNFAPTMLVKKKKSRRATT